VEATKIISRFGSWPGRDMLAQTKDRTMAPTKATISVELGAKQQAILQRQLETGHYENANEVLQDALLALDERGAVYEEWLRKKVQTSMANKRPGSPIDDVFNRVRELRKGK
jgi:antitoxin ParD1/3/4